MPSLRRHLEFLLMKKVQFIFGIHNHQPVGNFDDVFHHACDHSYLPFLQVLENFPGISMAFHFSGSLLEWLEENRRDVLDLFKKLVDRGNIEVLGAGFYEPILAMIPEADRVGQIQKMNNWAKAFAGYDVKGSWLTERVWEPHLVTSLKKAGIDYTIVDDFHFLSSVADPENLAGYYHTEQEGQYLGVFPISQKLRYAMPFEDPQVTIDILKQQVSEDGENVVVMADDGEKFGIWPGTYDLVYKQKWLERFFTLLEANADWLTTTTFKDYYTTHKPSGLVYLPTSSYFEMSQWTLPTRLGERMDRLTHELADQGREAETRPFIRGGMWRNFFTKYPESNWMQKRIQSLSLEVQQLEDSGKLDPELMDDLYRSQCNCAFWHGVFGGLYLPHLRHAIYEHLLKAESAFVEAGGQFKGLEDINGDGHGEYRLRSDRMQVFLSSHTGAVREIDWLPSKFNVTNYLQRYSEHYHHKLAHAGNEQAEGASIHDLVMTKEDGLQDKLFVDQYRRESMIDHFFSSADSLHSYYSGQFNPAMDSVAVVQAEAGVQIEGVAAGLPIKISKAVQLHDNELSISIDLMNEGTETIETYYGLEINFGLLGGNSPDRYFLLGGEHGGHLDTQSEDDGVSEISLVNEWDNFEIGLALSEKCRLWRAPIETISMSEAGFERVYQASSLLPHWFLVLSPGEKQKLSIELTINPYK